MATTSKLLVPDRLGASHCVHRPARSATTEQHVAVWREFGVGVRARSAFHAVSAPRERRRSASVAGHQMSYGPRRSPSARSTWSIVTTGPPSNLGRYGVGLSSRETGTIGATPAPRASCCSCAGERAARPLGVSGGIAAFGWGSDCCTTRHWDRLVEIGI